MRRTNAHLKASVIGRAGAWWLLMAGAFALVGEEVGRNHWSFQPIRKPPLPELRQTRWIRNPVDAFVLARLETLGVAPSPEADRATLLRRLSLDLRGVPPEPAEVRAFLEDPSPLAYERWVARYLGSPQFGEQWGQHWLDLARYADSDGYEKDSLRPHAWRYRDWVVQAINDDLPFDRFTLLQVAGDLLPESDVESRVATGFHRNTLTNKEGGVDQEEFRCKAVVDRVSTTGTVWLGLTLGCAECHDHKYDPVTQSDFYRFYAFFNSADEEDIPAPLPGETVGEDGRHETRAQVLVERAEPRETHVHVRGDFLRQGEKVEPGVLDWLVPWQARGPVADRLDLARWLVDPAHPLTRRVAVNRVWHHLFGEGLVRTPGDFGLRGSPPTHPQLLDWLACEWSEREWSRKQLITLIVTSSTYRQASRHRPELVARDPLNQWLARQNRFRLTAENIRDSFLAVSGLLQDRLGGKSIRPALPADVAALGYAGSVTWEQSPGGDSYRRGLYVQRQRTVPYPMLATFDSPDGNVTCPRRERSNTPLQALTLWNGPVFHECARALGRRVLQMFPADAEGQVRTMFVLVLGRDPTERELDRLVVLDRRQKELFRADPGTALELTGHHSEGELDDAIREASLMALARVLLNLDEFLTRE